MKKIVLITAISSMALISCKKDYTCECVLTNPSQSITSSTTIHATKSDAKTACEAGNSSNNSVTVVCTIK